MSELINSGRDKSGFRWRLLAGTSLSALLMAVGLQNVRAADDADRPAIWIELGGQLERVDGGQERFEAPFVSQIDTSKFVSPLDVQQAPRYGFGGEGKVSFEPQDSDWIFSAAVRYGRSNGSKSYAHHTTPPTRTGTICLAGNCFSAGPHQAEGRGFSNTAAKFSQSYSVLDFDAGKDVGLGMIGKGYMSTLNLGVRVAQFSSTTETTIDANNLHFYYYHHTFGPISVDVPRTSWQLYGANEHTTRNFRGLGPSLSWTGSIPIAGRSEGEGLMLDFGVNGALLFGRQKVRSHHRTVESYRSGGFPSGFYSIPTIYHHTHDVVRSRSVIVPNAGGFAGFSLKFPNAKVSVGYRADFFFGAMDGGIDARKTYDRKFYGPFATISVGLGE